jgi:light-regulated signal transduction histidine kinase (bacteriophytochrome)
LQAALATQPAWSDLPVFVMTRPMQTPCRHSLSKRLEGLGNISILDRPLRTETIVSTFRMALRARLRQYDIRDHLETERRAAAKLARANDELRRANEDLNQFAYSVSHDLQEPLRMVAVYTQMLQRSFAAGLPGKAADYMRFAVQGAKRMEELLKDLLSYVQVVDHSENGIERTDANEVLQQALQNLQSLIGASGATITSGPLPVVEIKSVHLLQLFQNLIGNALKYGGPQPAVSISAVRQDKEWRFNVCDDGIGVEPQFAQHIFGVFKRLHNGDDKYGGTGIGLAICQKIVERYGGRIWVESEGAGRGSTFCFTIPGADAKH